MGEEKEMDSANIEIVKLQLEVTELKRDIKELQKEIKDLVTAWNTAQGLTAFIKWTSTVIIALGTIMAFFSPHIKRMFS